MIRRDILKMLGLAATPFVKLPLLLASEPDTLSKVVLDAKSCDDLLLDEYYHKKAGIFLICDPDEARGERFAEKIRRFINADGRQPNGVAAYNKAVRTKSGSERTKFISSYFRYFSQQCYEEGIRWVCVQSIPPTIGQKFMVAGLIEYCDGDYSYTKDRFRFFRKF